MNNTACILAERKDLACPATDTRERIRQEVRSLRELKKRPGFLSAYNMVIRYMYLDVLSTGYDIYSQKAHAALRAYCVEAAGWNEIIIRRIISSRHQLKYTGRQPHPATLEELNKLVLYLENKWNSREI